MLIFGNVWCWVGPTKRSKSGQALPSPFIFIYLYTHHVSVHGELKNQLLRKYSRYIGSLTQESMKKRKKGKLPQEARHQLLDWWSGQYKWPYPSESQKLTLAESTGLDQKQINNWFINQRKRHWKPMEDMQFVAMNPVLHRYFLDNMLQMGNPLPMDISSPELL